MEIDSAVIIMQTMVDHYSMNVAQRNAWQAIRAALEELKCSHAAGGSSSGKPDSGTATGAAPTAPVPSCPPPAGSTQPPLNAICQNSNGTSCRGGFACDGKDTVCFYRR
jgi:hypothetical protein